MTEHDLPGSLFCDVDAYVERHEQDLVALVQGLVRFDTTSVDLSPGSEHRENEEAACQAFAADELRASGCEIDQWEPDARELQRHPMMPPWHHWEDRPITVGTLRGAGGGRSLIINGHIDVVNAGDPSLWSVPPFSAEIRDGRIVGRGSLDMKGGIAAAMFALRALKACDIRLAGDLIFEVVTDEETCAMGTIAAIERGYRADAGLVPEPTDMNLWVATRGILHGSVRIEGRSAHAEINQPSWQAGGGVNAIEKAAKVIGALAELSEEWSGREDKRHPLLGVPAIHPTLIRGGAFIANIPESCELGINTTYLPHNADASGFGSVPKGEIEAAVARVAEADEWLALHPPRWTWATDYPPCQFDPGTPIIDVARRAAQAIGRQTIVEGLDSAYDGALLTQFADTPSPAWGPGETERAHTTDESIGIDEVVQCARLYARAIVDWCGLAGGGRAM
ncbi:MAG: acetylornithine deacetylase or succinyl-diaminopimelate desuccinylase [Solirubrobacterales bacterium]|nr:acetylornithine deacetylase or succinyl-diaminopimelate desuccinylase [Solirubrobacterales bacterium]